MRQRPNNQTLPCLLSVSDHLEVKVKLTTVSMNHHPTECVALAGTAKWRLRAGNSQSKRQTSQKLRQRSSVGHIQVRYISFGLHCVLLNIRLIGDIKRSRDFEWKSRIALFFFPRKIKRSENNLMRRGYLIIKPPKSHCCQ